MYQPLWLKAVLFRHDVDVQVGIHVLDRRMPELMELKQHARDVVRKHDNWNQLRMLNPKKYCHFDNGILIIEGQSFGNVLTPWTLARHYLPTIQQDVAAVVVNFMGTRLQDTNGKTLVYVKEALISPTFPHYVYGATLASIIIREFTGVMLDYRPYVGRAMELTVEMDGSGWTVRSEPLAPLTAR